jgi:hypothetical protein
VNGESQFKVPLKRTSLYSGFRAAFTGAEAVSLGSYKRGSNAQYIVSIAKHRAFKFKDSIQWPAAKLNTQHTRSVHPKASHWTLCCCLCRCFEGRNDSSASSESAELLSCFSISKSRLSEAELSDTGLVGRDISKVYDYWKE